MNNHSNKFAIVTPVKDEIKYFPKTINSILNQKIQPNKWIIIDDGSTDGTTELIKQLESQNNWVEGVYREPEKQRKPGGEFVLGIGIKMLKLEDYDFIARMDGDLEFSQSYFQQLLERFEKDKNLGIASGVCWIMRDGKTFEEKHPRFHTRGPLKTYRTKCFKDIGGLESCLGWDAIDELKANMLGWKTHSFPDLKISHLKKTQNSAGPFKGGTNFGIALYNAGYHPLFVILKSFYILLVRRFKTTSPGLLWGYFSSLIKRKPRAVDKELMKYIRKQQMNKILGKKTIWN
jgi:biofilm PGA synthesis N-glycosyltransferase PgaC